MELSFQLPVIRKESAVEPLVTQTWGMAAGVTLNSMGVLFSYYYSMRDPNAGMIPLAWAWIPEFPESKFSSPDSESDTDQHEFSIPIPSPNLNWPYFRFRD